MWSIVARNSLPCPCEADDDETKSTGKCLLHSCMYLDQCFVKQHLSQVGRTNVMSGTSPAITMRIVMIEDWGRIIHRENKRLTHVQFIKSTDEYLQWCGVSKRPLSPDPWDRSISKRRWEKLVATWRAELRKTPRLEDCCGISGLKDEISSFLRECREQQHRPASRSIGNADGNARRLFSCQ